jgi:hypothetical protein
MQTKISDEFFLILICLCRICSYDVHFYIDTGSQFAVLADLDENSLMSDQRMLNFVLYWRSVSDFQPVGIRISGLNIPDIIVQ